MDSAFSLISRTCILAVFLLVLGHDINDSNDLLLNFFYTLSRHNDSASVSLSVKRIFVSLIASANPLVFSFPCMYTRNKS